MNIYVCVCVCAKYIIGECDIEQRLILLYIYIYAPIWTGKRLPAPTETDSSIIRGASGLRQPQASQGGGCC